MAFDCFPLVPQKEVNMEELEKWLDEEIRECEKRIEVFGNEYEIRRFYSSRKTVLLEVIGRIMLIDGRVDD